MQTSAMSLGGGRGFRSEIGSPAWRGPFFMRKSVLQPGEVHFSCGNRFSSLERPIFHAEIGSPAWRGPFFARKSVLQLGEAHFSCGNRFSSLERPIFHVGSGSPARSPCFAGANDAIEDQTKPAIIDIRSPAKRSLPVLPIRSPSKRKTSNVPRSSIAHGRGSSEIIATCRRRLRCPRCTTRSTALRDRDKIARAHQGT